MGMERLIEIMAALRGEGGCPWDREQTRESLKPYLVEEAYEVLEALEEGDPAQIREELGDLLFQIVFHARIGEERGEFDMNDVMEGISRKMVTRHPHVFGEAECATADDVRAQWEVIKKGEGKLRESILEGVPGSMPALLRAHRLQSRASGVGFDWKDVHDVVAKVHEELSEFEEALKAGRKKEVEEELGDLFFALVNVSRFVGVNPEDSLRKTITKFVRRFRYIESKAAEAGRELSSMTLEEMDALWDESKGLEAREEKS